MQVDFKTGIGDVKIPADQCVVPEIENRETDYDTKGYKTNTVKKFMVTEKRS